MNIKNQFMITFFIGHKQISNCSITLRLFYTSRKLQDNLYLNALQHVYGLQTSLSLNRIVKNTR